VEKFHEDNDDLAKFLHKKQDAQCIGIANKDREDTHKKELMKDGK
jgi:hypothetical protein